MKSETGSARRHQVSLAELHAGGGKRRALGLFLDAFGENGHRKLPAEPHQHLDHGPGRRIAADGIDEELVDLENVRAELLDVGQPAVTDADVVDRHLEAEAAQFGDARCRARQVVELFTLGHFEHDLPRRNPGGRDRLAHVPTKSRRACDAERR